LPVLRRIHAISAAIVLSALGFAASGCEDPKPTTTAPTQTAKPTSAPTAKPTAAPTAAPTSTAAAAAGKMSNCPSAVEGAKTEIKDVDGGVELSITASAEAATKDIRERAKQLAEAAKIESASRKHTGTGGGGGAFGRCPVVMRDTNVTLADIEGGTKITVKMKNAAEVDWLRRESRERLAELDKPGVKDAGQGKMVHCPSAVEGSKTSLKAAGDAVIVTVTATGDDNIKQVRERAKHLVEASKAEDKGKHGGDGTGGGGLGRCPVVLKDTTVTAKDVEGGAELTVTPKDKAGVDALLKEAESRQQQYFPTKPATK
jgi:TusA-related sulfurtransferase